MESQKTVNEGSDVGTTEERIGSGSSHGSLASSMLLVEFVDHYSGPSAVLPELITSIGGISMVDGRRVEDYSKISLTSGKCFVAKSPDAASLI